jgi:hypothetical protein
LERKYYFGRDAAITLTLIVLPQACISRHGLGISAGLPHAQMENGQERFCQPLKNFIELLDIGEINLIQRTFSKSEIIRKKQ